MLGEIRFLSSANMLNSINSPGLERIRVEIRTLAGTYNFITGKGCLGYRHVSEICARKLLIILPVDLEKTEGFIEARC